MTWLWLVASAVESGGSQGLLQAPQTAGAEASPHPQPQGWPSSEGLLHQCPQLCAGPGGTLAARLVVASIYAKCQGAALLTIARTAYDEKES